jgi:metal-dependent amidase/aminoacylase/carboxypeptidase family protein
MFTFQGRSAHSAGSPWAGRSALDAVELMNVGWNFRREHLRLQQRSHYVIANGGSQPNVVPSEAASGTTSASSTTRASGAARDRPTMARPPP